MPALDLLLCTKSKSLASALGEQPHMTRIDGRSATNFGPSRSSAVSSPIARGACSTDPGQRPCWSPRSFSDKVPPFLEGKGVGWLTAEYAMLPGSTPRRKSRADRRPGHRDSAADRPESPRVIDRTGARTLDHSCRRRRARRRRRHPHRRHHGRVRRRGRRGADAVRRRLRRRSSATASPPSARGSWRRAGARPRLRRRLDGRGRPERRPAGPRRPCRGAGHRRRREVLAAQLDELLDLAEAGIDHLARPPRECLGQRLAAVRAEEVVPMRNGPRSVLADRTFLC